MTQWQHCQSVTSVEEESTSFPQVIHQVIHIIHQKHKIFCLNGYLILDLVVDNSEKSEDFDILYEYIVIAEKRNFVRQISNSSKKMIHRRSITEPIKVVVKKAMESQRLLM